MKKFTEINWLTLASEENYTAAESYLSLLYSKKILDGFIKKLQESEIVEYKSKDIFRASKLSLLGTSSVQVARDKKRIIKGFSFSPLLLVRHQGKLIVADGYHRLCAIYSLNEDLLIHCKMA